MVKCKNKGPRAKTRGKLSKSPRKRGLPNVNSFLREFQKGEAVHIKPESSVHNGMPCRRFLGKTGKIVKKQGDCYVVTIKDFNAKKEVIVHPVHLHKQVS